LNYDGTALLEKQLNLFSNWLLKIPYIVEKNTVSTSLFSSQKLKRKNKGSVGDP
jgi:hypothetical protein